MSILKSILGSLKGRKSPSVTQIVSIVKKRSNTGLGGFVDINNDLGLLLEENKEPEPGLLMPYFYARRVAAAGMFSQGAIASQDFDKVEALFFNFMAQVGNEISQEEQVEFQEASLDSALELIEKYLVGITKQSAPLLIVAAKQGISVRDALLESFNESDDELAVIVEPVMCRDWIMKAEYCAGFFATGWWGGSDDFEATSEKIVGYLGSIGLTLEARHVSFGGQHGEPRLIEYVDQVNSSHLGPFANMLEDVKAAASQSDILRTPLLSAAVGYSMELAVAALWVAGGVHHKIIEDTIEGIYMFKADVGSDQELHNEALAQAVELANVYTPDTTVEHIEVIVGMTKDLERFRHEGEPVLEASEVLLRAKRIAAI